ncbi:hypothetical protein AC578_7011 [Pseudocercospora eumusae]|uniref:Prion-inhibition and propagation HeLo domain-containing protein n=1 Tax=Pseudocercospora eumusae TaxID=321146 RepID=A0A139HCW6_9PEZI|nr:hypothetical protein AC578_7011 [Pseudocercospora eumusae]
MAPPHVQDQELLKLAEKACVGKSLKQINISRQQQLALKLSILQLAFERWVKCVSKSEDHEPRDSISSQDRREIQGLLEGIASAIKDARAEGDFNEVTMNEPDTDVDEATIPTFSQAESVNGLVAEIGDKVRQLVSFFPESLNAQARMASEDLTAMAPTGDPSKRTLLLSLANACADTEPMLEQAISKETSVQHTYINNRTEGNAKATFGDIFSEGSTRNPSAPGHTYKDNLTKDNAQTHFGDVYGKSPFA